MKNLLPYIFAMGLLFSCSPRENKEYKLGELTFDVTGSEEAKEIFKKVHLLLHSFEYQDACEVFLEAQKADPDFAMAYWGEAMTYNHSIWQEQDLEKGREALRKLGETAEDRIGKAKTELEKKFIQSLNILYGEGSKTDRDQAYARFMGELYQRYPDNHEVASFYALSLLGSVTVGRSDDVYQQSARISEKILQENPNHPGALHYFIHANDDPYHAGTAVEVANEYAVVAPDAAHALHMPTHIYLALGMWDKVVSSNEVSWQASVNRKERKNLSNDAYGYHSYHWLQYGYLQQGRLEEARKTLENMIQYCAELPSARARAHEVFFKSTYLVETNDWNSEFSLKETDTKELNILTRSMEAFVKGMKFYHTKDNASLENLILAMEKDRQVESAKISDAGIALCNSGGANRENATVLDVNLSHVLEMELRAMQAWMQNDLETTERWLKEASTLEANVSYSYGPPAVVKPSHELYGEFLLSLNRAEEAIAQFDKALQLAPKRVMALRGKLKAATQLKNTQLIDELERQIQEIVKASSQPMALAGLVPVATTGSKF
jgi:tetratricopeptide (TPR) repeat protein